MRKIESGRLDRHSYDHDNGRQCVFLLNHDALHCYVTRVYMVLSQGKTINLFCACKIRRHVNFDDKAIFQLIH
jgi:hypothetical protein